MTDVGRLFSFSRGRLNVLACECVFNIISKGTVRGRNVDRLGVASTKVESVPAGLY